MTGNKLSLSNVYEYRYDVKGRMVKKIFPECVYMRFTITDKDGNGRTQTIKAYAYDEAGRLQSVARGGSAGSVSYAYNLKGWPTRIDSNEFLKDPIEIVLFSCCTGSSPYGFPSFAQELSRRTENISVFAPDAEIGIYYYEGTTRIDDNKNWKQFQNGALINEYKGDNVIPGTEGFDESRDRDLEFEERKYLYKWEILNTFGQD